MNSTAFEQKYGLNPENAMSVVIPDTFRVFSVVAADTFSPFSVAGPDTFSPFSVVKPDTFRALLPTFTVLIAGYRDHPDAFEIPPPPPPDVVT
jgi:hypothetical protein